MWSQRVQEERGRIMCWADLGATGLSVQGPVGDGGQISAVIIMLRGRCSPSLPQPLLSYPILSQTPFLSQGKGEVAWGAAEGEG